MRKLLTSCVVFCALIIGSFISAATASAYPDCSNLTGTDWTNCQNQQNQQNWINNYTPPPGAWGPNGHYTPCTGDAASIASGNCGPQGHG
jgi:hypothetical protein